MGEAIVVVISSMGEKIFIESNDNFLLLCSLLNLSVHAKQGLE